MYEKSRAQKIRHFSMIRRRCLLQICNAFSEHTMTSSELFATTLYVSLLISNYNNTLELVTGKKEIFTYEDYLAGCPEADFN